MMAVANSSIEWTDSTWSPVTGCTKVSPGCDNCYAEGIARRFTGTKAFPNGFEVTLHPERLEQPLKWRKPRRIFVNSMSDLFHDQVPDEYIAEVFVVMATAPHHTFQLLTKRHARMRALLSNPDFALLAIEADLRRRGRDASSLRADVADQWRAKFWPLANVWLGVSVENQQWADIRIPALLNTPAAVRFLSCEPLLGPVDLAAVAPHEPYWHDRIDWVIAGGESGPGARPMHSDWARSLRDQCQAVGVPFFYKQAGEYLAVPIEDDPRFAGGRAFTDPRGGRSAAMLRQRGPSGTFRAGEFRPMQPGDETRGTVMLDANTIAVRVGKKAAGRMLDGRTWDEFPAVADV